MTSRPSVDPVRYSDADCAGCGARIWPGYNFENDEYPNAFKMVFPQRPGRWGGIEVCHDCMMALQAAILVAHVARYDIMEGVPA